MPDNINKNSVKENPSDKPAGFSNRIPQKIDIKDLDKDWLLVSKNITNSIIKIKQKELNNPKATKTYIYHKVENANKTKIYDLYISKNEAYIIGPLLGEGSSGKVFLAQNAETGQWACMKQFKIADPKVPVMEEIELDILKEEGMFRSSNRKSDEAVLISELIKGDELYNLIIDSKGNLRKNTLSFEQTLALSISLLESYEALARKKYVHRDIKADNIMVDMDHLKCVLIDFGSLITKPQVGDLTGTPEYMSPEMLRRDSNVKQSYTMASDLYALGMVAAKMVSTILPQTGTQDISNIDRDRVNYRKELYASWSGVFADPKEFFDDMIAPKHEAINPIIFATKDVSYQEKHKLSPELIKLSQVFYDMTDKESKRSSIKNLQDSLKSLKEIRFMQIKKGKSTLIDTDYRKKYYDELIQLRQKLVKNRGLEDSLIDDMDSFMLRMVDSIQQNRPNKDTIEVYIKTIKNTLEGQKKINEQLLSLYKRIQPPKNKIKHDYPLPPLPKPPIKQFEGYKLSKEELLKRPLPEPPDKSKMKKK